MNFIRVTQEDRLAVLVSLVRRIRNSITVVFSETQVKFLSEFFHHLKISAEITTKAPKDGFIIYYDPPKDVPTKGVLFILPEEESVLTTNYQEQIFPKSKQSQFVNEDLLKLTSKNYAFNVLAENAYKDFMNHYQRLGGHYNVLSLNPNRICKAFGFEVTPKINNFVLKRSHEYSTADKPKVKLSRKTKKISKVKK